MYISFLAVWIFASSHVKWYNGCCNLTFRYPFNIGLLKVIVYTSKLEKAKNRVASLEILTSCCNTNWIEVNIACNNYLKKKQWQPKWSKSKMLFISANAVLSSRITHSLDKHLCEYSWFSWGIFFNYNYEHMIVVESFKIMLPIEIVHQSTFLNHWLNTSFMTGVIKIMLKS